MNFFFKFFEKISQIFLKMITINYKSKHKFQNKNQITNTQTILFFLKNKNINPNIIIDVGCGYGEWFLKANPFFKDSNFLLFDADKKNSKNLIKLKKRFPNINYKICLLSNKVHDVNFFNMGYGSSIYEENTSHPRSVELLTSTTLDIELSNYNFLTKNNLIKLDVQGSELDILNGLNQKLKHFEIIILETSIQQYNKNSPLFFNVINFMDKNNFRLFDIFDTKRLGDFNSYLVQCDCLFVRKDSSLFDVKF